jgi:archaellum component FlaC
MAVYCLSGSCTGCIENIENIKITFRNFNVLEKRILETNKALQAALIEIEKLKTEVKELKSQNVEVKVLSKDEKKKDIYEQLALQHNDLLEARAGSGGDGIAWIHMEINRLEEELKELN